jgi:beta-lactamase regulating signal transducer with metallopeptidase domain
MTLLHLLRSALLELFAASVAGGIACVVLRLARPIAGRVFSAAWNYYACLIPAALFLGAGAAALPLAASVGRALPAVHVAYAPSAASVSAYGSAGQYAAGAQAAGEYAAGAYAAAAQAAGQAAGSAGIGGFAGPVLHVLFAVWLAGFICSAARAAASYRRFRGAALSGSRPMRCECALPAVPAVPVVISPCAAAPMLVGAFRPVIVMPDRQYGAERLRFIIAHETAHLRRGDMLIKLALLLAQCAHWFNPAAYLLNRDASRLCEEACDASLARRMDGRERRLYGEAILFCAETDKTACAPLCAGMTAAGCLKRRLLALARYRRVKKAITLVSVAAAIALAGGGLAARAAFGVVETEKTVEAQIAEAAGAQAAEADAARAAEAETAAEEAARAADEVQTAKADVAQVAEIAGAQAAEAGAALVAANAEKIAEARAAEVAMVAKEATEAEAEKTADAQTVETADAQTTAAEATQVADVADARAAEPKTVTNPAALASANAKRNSAVPNKDGVKTYVLNKEEAIAEIEFLIAAGDNSSTYTVRGKILTNEQMLEHVKANTDPNFRMGVGICGK